MHVLPKAREVGAVLVTIGLLFVLQNHAAAKSAGAAARFAVPVLCTDNRFAAHTKTRGTGVIIDASGLILTAAHVVQGTDLYCKLTVLVPNDEWSRAAKFYPFAVDQCLSDQLLDVAVCHITPLDDSKDRRYLSVGEIRPRGVVSGKFATITGFTGWGWFPTVSSGTVLPPQLYHTHEGCYCDLAVNSETHEGMSGSPIVDEDGLVIGVVTLSGTGRFRGITFGTGMESAIGFLRKHGWMGTTTP